MGDGLPNTVLGALPSLVLSSLNWEEKHGYKLFSSGDLFLYILIKMYSCEFRCASLIKGMTVIGWFRGVLVLASLGKKNCAVVVAMEAKMAQLDLG